ncbi:MAG: hypothetical protein Q9227_009021 [Pyrenula ochraceoflavens]
MKALRRSLKGDKDGKPQHVSLTPKDAVSIIPPKKVIKALYDFEPLDSNGQHLAFHRGDFFHVISREDDTDWYEACNPLIPTARGLVPVSYFEVIGKQERASAGSMKDVGGNSGEAHDSGYSENRTHGRSESMNATRTGTGLRMSNIVKGSGAMVYGMVMYDFNAERPDELEAKSGEAIIVIAQSNPEWFVAKPIGRLGGPGLIPVSFIEIRDMTTGQAVADPHEAVQRAGVPKVEEWKKMAADYKNSSISLGKFDAPSQQSMASDMGRMSLNGPGQAQQQQYSYQPNNNYVCPPLLPLPPMNPPQVVFYPQLLAPISASIPRYIFDNDVYYYIVECQMEDGRWWELRRFYGDFYDFQIALLKQFPEEAGNEGKPRTIPYMPGPVAHVTDAISAGRKQNLDEYVKLILALPPHISRSNLVRQLFQPRSSDYEIDPSALGEEYRLSGASQQSQGPSRTASRQSSRGQMNGGVGGGYGQTQSARSMHQRGNPSLSAVNGQYRQQGSMTQASTNGNGTNNASYSQPMMPSNTNGSGALKLKIFFQHEIISLRVPADISLRALVEKIRERLKINEEIMVQYKDEASNGQIIELMSDRDLDVAIQRNPKLSLVVSFLP